MRHRRRSAAGLALVLCLLAGCTGEDRQLPPPAGAPAEPGPMERGPAAGALPAARPFLALLAAVDLSPAVPGAPATATAAVGSPDGGAYVVLSTPDPGLPHQLVSVARTDGGYAVTGSLPIPRLRPVWDMHVLADGRVLVSGQFRGDRPGYGFLSVDPADGTVWTAEVIPFEDG